jgi:RNA polymerase sigma-70 factor (ECF subfamily)
MPPGSEPADGSFEDLASPYRRELLAHCYRMLGSAQDAEDLVQETLIRAWRGYDSFDGRSSLRTWLYRIATNACLTALQSSHRRVLPSGLGQAVDEPTTSLTRIDSTPWLGPIETSWLGNDPAGVASMRDSTRLALVAAFQVLPARQRAVLILIDVVGFRPAEAAEFLGLSHQAARSLLQRARARLAKDTPDHDEIQVDPDADEAVLDRYLQAFRTQDMAGIAALLRDDIEYEMPPFSEWFRGHSAVLDHFSRRVFSEPRLVVPTAANGFPALGTYSRRADGVFAGHGIEVLETIDGMISRIVVFLDPALLGQFGLPATLAAPPTA